MHMMPFLVAWIALGVATLGLALYRKFLTMKEDDLIHMEQWQAGETAKQTTAARKFHAIDRWGETLTIVTLVGGLALAIAYACSVVART